MTMGQTRVEWYTREYICANGVCEKTKFPVRVDWEPSAETGREARRVIRRAEKNITQAKHEAARQVNNNFRAGRDYLFTGTVDEAGMEKLVTKAGTDDEDALLMVMRREIGNLIRRVKYALRDKDITWKYWAVPSDREGKTGLPARVHCHIFVSAEAAEAMEQAWSLGFGGCRLLWSAHQGDLTDLVEYLLDQTRQIGTEKRYIPSRNLEAPEATRPRLAKNPDAPLRVPKDASLIYRSEQRAGRPQKIRYYRASKDRACAIHPAGECGVYRASKDRGRRPEDEPRQNCQGGELDETE